MGVYTSVRRNNLLFRVSVKSDRFSVIPRTLFQREEVPDDYYKHDPDHKHIYRFVRTLFSAAQLTAECAIVTLVRGAPGLRRRLLGDLALSSSRELG